MEYGFRTPPNATLKVLRIGLHLSLNGLVPVFFCLLAKCDRNFVPNILEIIRNRRDRICLGSVVLFCLVTFLVPILVSGLPNGYDLNTDLRFASTLYEEMGNAVLFPGWANDNFGYGSVGIRFYPPVSLHGLAVGKMISGEWYDSIVANLTFWMCLGCVGVFLFAREWGSPLEAMMAGMIYAVVPQHLSEIHAFFLYAEFAAWGVLPFCFLFVSRICRDGKWVDVFLFATFYSVLILTHIPTTIIVSLCLPLYVLLFLGWPNLKSASLQLAVAVVLAIAMTSFRLVQIIVEFDWLAHNGPAWSAGNYASTTWLFPNILETRKMPALTLSAGLTDITIALTILLLVPPIVYLFTSRKTTDNPTRKFLTATTITALFALLMLSKPSTLIWKYAELLQKIQFPWRWLSILSMFGTISFSLAITRLAAKYDRHKRLVIYSGLAAILAMVIFDITQVVVPSAPMNRDQFETIERELTTEPIFEGWWPKWAREKAFENRERVVAGNRTVEIARWETGSREFTVQQGDPTDLRVATFYYPYWKARINGIPIDVHPDETGAMKISIQDEVSTVQLKFEEPDANRVARWVSLVSWFVMLLLGVFSVLRYKLV